MTNAHWIATCSNGTTAVEHKGEWQLIPGQRKPWVRFVDKLAADGLHLTSLRLNIEGRTIHLPRPSNNKFESKPPLYYSLQYMAELDDLFGAPTQKDFVDLAAHYDGFAVHVIQDLTDGNTSWVTVTGNDAMAPSPRHEGGGS